MANTITKRVLAETGKRYAFFLTIDSTAGDEETGTVLADLSALPGAPTKCAIRKLVYAASAAAATVELLWDHTTDDRAWKFKGSSNLTEFCFECGNGVIDPASAGGTGDLLLTTTGLAAGDIVNLYVELELLKA